MKVLERPDRQCGATNRLGARCGNWAVRGAGVCRFHGGNYKRTRAAAQRRLAEAKAAKSLARLGVPTIDDPAGALLGVAEESRALLTYLMGYAAKLADDPAGADPLELRARLEAASRQQERTARMLAEITKLGLAEQRLALDAQRVQIVRELLDRVVVALGHDPADASVRAVIGREVLALPSAPVIEGEVLDLG